MYDAHFQALPYPESLLKRCLREEIDRGIAMAADPKNANLPDLALRTTTINSPWYTQTCSICKHKFREGDQVRLCPQCNEPYHDDIQYGLHCWQKKFAEGQICTKGRFDRFSEREIPRCDFTWSGASLEEITNEKETTETTSVHPSPAASLVKQFISGLENIWRPFGEQPIIKVEFSSEAVGRSCPWCRFHIRAGDWVVACPCGCGTYFHQDVFRHLTCWNGWNGIEGNNYCPNTGRSYE